MKIAKLFIITLIFIIFSDYLFPQIDNIPADHAVYNFLSSMYNKGVLEDYNDVVLPLSRNQVKTALFNIREHRQSLNQTDRFILDRMIQKLGFNDSVGIVNVFDSFPEKFIENVFETREKHLYAYRDSVISFNFDPIFEYKFIYSDKNGTGSSLINFGGRIRGSYDDWFGYYVDASNGTVIGNRTTAALDKRVEQSFTFNDTKINFFDNTQGYLRLEKDHLSIQLGRERILWGTGRLNKLILSDNPQIFDFVKIKLNYKSLRYDFLHGWLVQKPEFIQINKDISKEKRSKQIAISRFEYSPNRDFFMGISQMIIYSNRSFEPAYLNPFLFWESAQRSLNDLDNSFLSIDGRYRLTEGLVVNASAIVDDINFSRLFKGEWAGHNNGFAWQSGISITSPIILENMVFNVEYLQLRPYIFSHPGYHESLTYTNNSYLLGVDLNPNSTLLSLSVEYNFSDRINVGIFYDFSLHGNNEYDSLGNRIRNVGGNVFEYYTLNDSKFAYLLDGVRETENRLHLIFSWELFNGIYFKFDWEYRNNSFVSNKNYNAFLGSIKLDFD